MSALLERLIGELQRTAPPKPHPNAKLLNGTAITVLIAVGGMLIAWGSLGQRVTNLEELKPRVQMIEQQMQAIYEVKAEQQALRRDIERYFAEKKR
jgi:hypothetical protein